MPYLLNRVGVGIGTAFSEHLRRFDITLAGYRVLASLVCLDGQTIAGLANHTSIDISTLSRLINGLEAKGLVQRRRDEQDARSTQLFLLPEGRLLAAQTIPTGMLLERVVTAGFSEEEITTLKAMLQRMYANLGTLSL